MSTYKVIQDVEAEDKLVGPLTLRQFIYAGIAALSGYLGFLSAAKGAAFMLVIFLPITVVFGFFAFPWGKDQPTEIWALAKIRFLFKPRRRIWDQSGTKDLVTVTAPKHIERRLTNGLDQDEVRSRLNALASTIDSRGWAVKNVNVNLSNGLPVDTSDRLVHADSMPQEVNSVDVRASDDILDEAANPIAQQFDRLVSASSVAHRQELLARMRTPSLPTTGGAATLPAIAGSTPATPPVQTPADYWFMQPTVAAAPGQATFSDAPVITPGTAAQPVVPQAAVPTAEEEAMVDRLKQQNQNAAMSAAYGHMKTLKTPEQLAAEAKAAAAQPAVTRENQAAIMDLANNDDLDVATIARQARKRDEHGDDGEVVISLR